MNRKGHLLLTVIILLISCSDKKKFIENIDNTADNISNEMKIIMDETFYLGREIEKILTTNENVDITKMDVESGGKYSLFENTAYFKKYKQGDSALIFTGAYPLNDSDKVTIKKLEEANSLLIQSTSKSEIITASWIFSKRCIANVYPPIDLISALKPGLDFTSAPFYQLVSYKNNPAKDMKWDNDGEPMVAMAGEGWTMARHYPIYLDDDNIMDFMVSVQTLFSKINNLFITDNNANILLISKDLNIVGSSKNMSRLIKFNKIEEFDYLTQMETNTFVAERFNLGHETQPEILINLKNKMINEDNNIYLKSDENKYYIHYKRIPELPMYIVGFMEVN